MNTHLTARDVEALTAGSLSISAPVGDGAIGALRDALIEACRDASESSSLNLGGLRAFVSGHDFANTVLYWQEQAGEAPSGTSSSQHAVAVAKTVSWQVDSSLVSVVVLHPAIAQLLSRTGWAGSLPLVRRLLLHELAHVHDEARRFSLCGPDGHARQTTPAVPAHSLVARCAWSEYFADRVAARHLTKEDAAELVTLWQVVVETQQRIAALRREFEQTQLGQQFWSHTLTLIADCAMVLCRCLGSFAGQNWKTERCEFLRALDVVPLWRSLARDLVDELGQLYQLPDGVWPPVETTIGPRIPGLWEQFGIQLSDDGHLWIAERLVPLGEGSS